jgi:organic radical activating enzyme
MMFHIEKLDMHVTDSCNLHCEQCDHFSNYGFKGTYSVATLQSWCEKWSSRIFPRSFHILGGEPLINKEICEIVEMCAREWKHSQIILWSNGLLVNRHPNLPKVLKENGVRLHISNHSTENSPAYDLKFQECVEVLKSWYEQHECEISLQFNNGLHIEFGKDEQGYLIKEHVVDVGPEKTLWEKFYQGHGKNMQPFDDADPEMSWANCTAKCPQLYNGKLHKCAPLTFLPLIHNKYGLSEDWKPYLEYQGLEASCTDDELANWLGLKAEKFCGMCPKKRPRFTSKLDPLFREKHDENKPGLRL